MKVLFTGSGTSGSWQIRGVQLARALGAASVPAAGVPDFKRYDVIVAVKRVSDTLLQQLRASGRPWVWDVVDAYPQPQCASWNKGQAVDWVRARLQHLKPTAVVWPTARMRDDVGMGGSVVYHHHRPGMAVNPVRQRIRVVGYEGAPGYLAHWLKAFTAAAENIGARFDPQLRTPADADVIVAARGGAQDCYACRNWKSNVKLANAHGSGTPFIGQPDAGYTETASGDEQWIESPADVPAALERLFDRGARQQVQDQFMRRAMPLDQVAGELRAVLARLR